MSAIVPAPGVMGLPLAFVLATCSAHHAQRCRARIDNGEVAVEPVRAVVVGNRWWALVQFARPEAGEILFPLDAYAIDAGVYGEAALDALCVLRRAVPHDAASGARAAP